MHSTIFRFDFKKNYSEYKCYVPQGTTNSTFMTCIQVIRWRDINTARRKVGIA